MRALVGFADPSHAVNKKACATRPLAMALASVR